MNDIVKKCVNCQHEHRWGILRMSLDNTPLYGPRTCWCHCDRFTPAPDEGDKNLPAMTDEQTKSLWEETSFLNAQAPAATRMVVAKLMQLGKGDVGTSMIGRLFGRGIGKTPMERMWPEFVGFVISQITDMRGALVRDENKFAHLVAHTDEIVESMKGVVQLNERLMNVVRSNEALHQEIDELRTLVCLIAKDSQVAHSHCLECGHPSELHIGGCQYINNDDNERCACEAKFASPSELRRVMHGNAPLKDEAVVVDPDHLDE